MPWCRGGGGGGGPTVVAVPPGQAAFKEAVDDFGPDNAADTSYRSTPAQLKCIAHECSTLHCNRLLNCNSSSMKAGSNAQLKTASGFSSQCFSDSLAQNMPNFGSKEGPKISTNIYWSVKQGLIGLILCAAIIGNAIQFDAVFLPWIFSTLVFFP